MAKKSREQLLAEAKERQRKRKKGRDKVKDIQTIIPKVIPGVPPWATALARAPEAVDIASMAFSQRPHDALLIEALERGWLPSPHKIDMKEIWGIGESVRAMDQLDAADILSQTVPTPVAAGGKSARQPRKRSDKQLINDQIQSNALKSINGKARKKDGTFKKGWSQKKVMRWAQKECTKERERLGLCKRKRKRGKSSR